VVINGWDPFRAHQRHGSRWVRWLCLSIILWANFLVPVRADTEVSAVADLLKAGEYLAALTLLEDLKPLRPCDPDLLFLEARVYETAGETVRAIALYEILIKLFPDFPEPYNNLAVLYATLGKLQRTETLLLRGLATHTTYRQLQRNLSRVYVARAAQAYRKALSIETPPGSTDITSSSLQLLDSDTLVQQKMKVSIPPASECQQSGNNQ
jgi:tetratricopeptide (TPR) repeat protein